MIGCLIQKEEKNFKFEKFLEMSSLNVKLSELDKLETELIEAMQIASKCTSELVKDKIAHKYLLQFQSMGLLYVCNFRMAENHVQDFLKRIRTVENGILSHINYLNQVGIGVPHEGAAYMATFQRQASVDRTNYLYNKFSEDEKRMKEKEETNFNSEDSFLDDDEDLNMTFS